MTLHSSIGPCVLKRKRRRTLAISVLPDGAVEVVAPVGASEDAIREKLEKKTRWILRQRRAFAALNAKRPPRRYRTGATHRYLGRQVRLKVTVGAEQSVKLRGASLCVVSRTGSEKSVAVLVSGWMRARAKEQFARRLKGWRTWCAERELPEPRLRLLSMPKRWGSAHKNGTVALNPELVRAPSVCIDYVIAHELCHLKHPQHGKAFHAELDRLCPNWKGVKLRLESLDL
ncbi:MAG: SprT family zinc-dependent metalloprotease [Kiritimatiellae bacterium]|nr:SprT family zinc-dependent metalloprotease [Kiritimatiellia bacterium]